jgi:hypothetical protein
MPTDNLPHFTYSKQDDINDSKSWTASDDAELINEVRIDTARSVRTPLPVPVPSSVLPSGPRNLA